MGANLYRYGERVTSDVGGYLDSTPESDLAQHY
jgi:hypothetical protein